MKLYILGKKMWFWITFILWKGRNFDHVIHFLPNRGYEIIAKLNNHTGKI